jgi:DNA-3-methyladenine glycosylase II
MTSREPRLSKEIDRSSGHPSIEEALRLLSESDPRLAALMTHVGPCGLQHRASEPFSAHGHYAGLVVSIISQQLSAKAADTISGRVRALASGPEFPSPADMLAIPEERLRQAGLSGAKARYVRNLSAQVNIGALRLDAFNALEDEAVIENLCQIKGIGRWTAEMFLIFRLGRLDILPLGDRGIQRGLELLFSLRAPPSAERMIKLARPWRPYRSVACWYLWRLTEMGEAARNEIRSAHRITVQPDRMTRRTNLDT